MLPMKPGNARRWRVALPVAVVIAMTIATAVALVLTRRQANVLATPKPYGDLWYLYSIDSALWHLRSTADHFLDGKVPASDLTDQLEIVLSIVLPNSAAPTSQTPTIERMPEVQQELNFVRSTVDGWSDLEAEGSPASIQKMAREIQAKEFALHGSIERSLGIVHVENLNEHDRERDLLHRSFVFLVWVMIGLLAGMIVLITRLVLDYKQAVRLSSHLADLNNMLEERIEIRTRELAEGRELLSFILEASPSDVVLTNSDDGKVHFMNSQFRRRLGLDENVARIALSDLFQNPDDGKRFLEEIENRGILDGWEAILTGSKPFWSTISARKLKISGNPAHLFWSYDISTRKVLEEQLRALATTDVLTGLWNRREFMIRGASLIAHNVRHGHPCAVLMIDIDRFKQINDQYGHTVGDEAIKAIGVVFRKELRSFDLAGRLGGEEFAAMLPETGLEVARDVAERLRKAVAQIQVTAPEGTLLGFTISIGISVLVENKETGLMQLLQQADKALYEAKNKGRNATAVFLEQAHIPG